MCLECTSNTKIDQLHFIVICHHYIRWLEIAEDDRRRLAMQVAQYATKLLRPTARPRFWHASRSIDPHDIPFLLQHFTQRLSLDKIHHQVVLPTFDKEIAYAGNTRVIKVEQQCCLASKPLNRLGTFVIALKLVQHLLHSAWTIEARIYGSVNGPHATCSYRFLDLIASS